MGRRRRRTVICSPTSSIFVITTSRDLPLATLEYTPSRQHGHARISDVWHVKCNRLLLGYATEVTELLYLFQYITVDADLQLISFVLCWTSLVLFSWFWFSFHACMFFCRFLQGIIIPCNQALLFATIARSSANLTAFTKGPPTFIPSSMFSSAASI